MRFGNIDALVNGTESVVYYHEVTGAGESTISTGNILNGDEDGWYTVIVRPTNSGTTVTRLQFNGDGGTNYGQIGQWAENTTVTSDGATGRTYIGYVHGTGLIVYRIYAKSGAVRLVNSISCYGISTTTVTGVEILGSVWNNTIDNIVSMSFVCSSGDFANGTTIIILKSNNFTGGTPTGVINTPYIKNAWVRVGSWTATDGDTTKTFSSLSGNTAVVYRMIVQRKQRTANGNLIITLNGDSTSKYGFQRLRAQDTTVSAYRGTSETSIYDTLTAVPNEYCMYESIIFSKSGFIHPVLSFGLQKISGTTVSEYVCYGQVYNDTSEISSITTSLDGGDFATGSTIDLYALYK